jgi:hypothetical protein
MGGDPLREATTVQLALEGVETYRHAEESAWPYDSPAFPADRPRDACDPARQAEMVTWRRMTPFDADAVAQASFLGQGIVLTIGVVLGAWQASGLIDAPAGRKTPGAHAVLAVGNIAVGSETRTLIKNSWGTGWGQQGYGFMTRRYFDSYVRAAHVLEPAA